MPKYLLIICCGILLVSAKVSAQKNIDKIRKLIEATSKISVDNISSKSEGDIIIPNRSIGFDGQGSNRKQLFEETRRLSRVLEKFVAFDPNEDALYPGALIQGSSLKNGTLNPINVNRNPITITISNLNSSDPNIKYSTTIKHPSKENVTEAIAALLRQKISKDQPAKLSYSQVSVYSKEQGLLSLGASFDFISTKGSGEFQMNSSNYRTSYMVRFVQSYFTVSCAPPSNPSSFISSNSSFDDFKTYVGEGNPPTYISSVTYGREIWMLIQSNHDENSVRSAIQMSFDALVYDGTLEFNSESAKVFNESSLQVLILGGSTRPAIKTIKGNAIEGLKDYLSEGASFSAQSPGVVISYTVRYLKDNDVARISSSTDYVIRTATHYPEIKIVDCKIIFNTRGDNQEGANIVILLLQNGREVWGKDMGSRFYDDPSNNSLEFQVDYTIDEKKPITGVRVKLKDNKSRFNVSWRFNATIILNKSDGSQLRFSGDNLYLDTTGKVRDYVDL